MMTSVTTSTLADASLVISTSRGDGVHRDNVPSGHGYPVPGGASQGHAAGSARVRRSRSDRLARGSSGSISGVESSASSPRDRLLSRDGKTSVGFGGHEAEGIALSPYPNIRAGAWAGDGPVLGSGSPGNGSEGRRSDGVEDVNLGGSMERDRQRASSTSARADANGQEDPEGVESQAAAETPHSLVSSRGSQSQPDDRPRAVSRDWPLTPTRTTATPIPGVDLLAAPWAVGGVAEGGGHPGWAEEGVEGVPGKARQVDVMPQPGGLDAVQLLTTTPKVRRMRGCELRGSSLSPDGQRIHAQFVPRR